MKFVFLDSAISDIAWMRNYYAHVFPEGAQKARENIKAARRLLTANPHAGHPTEIKGLGELQIPRTPFAFLYRVNEGMIEVLRIWDGRADRAALALD